MGSDSAEQQQKMLSLQENTRCEADDRVNRDEDYESCGSGGYDAVVVGSGYGGAVAACRLAQAGLKVCVLERGRVWQSPNFPDSYWQSLREVELHTPFGTFGKENGLYQVRLDGESMSLTGAGVGGGSLISAGLAAATPKRARNDPRWPCEWERDWPVYEALSHAVLEPDLVPCNFPKKKVMDAIKDELDDVEDQLENIRVGMRFKDGTNVAGVKQDPCKACGNCITGCNFNAKSSTEKNYLALAVQAGAHVRTETKVQFIAKNVEAPPFNQEDVCACASWRSGNVRKNQAEGGRSSKRKWRVYLDDVTFLTANIVVLGAGVLGTNEILLRSRERGLRLSDRLGKGVSTNGNNIAFVSESPAPTRGNGVNGETFANVPMSERPGPSICNSYTTSAGYTIQAAALPKNTPYGFIRMWTYGSATESHAISHIPNVLWGQLKQWAKTKNSNLLVLNMMGDDAADGEIIIDKSTGRVRFTAPQDIKMVKKISACQRLAKRMKGKLYVSQFRSSSVHLLGGCNAALTPKNGVANPQGNVFNPDAEDLSDTVHPGLYVCDAALIPCSVGVNPTNTILTVAERVSAAAVAYASTTFKEIEEKTDADGIGVHFYFPPVLGKIFNQVSSGEKDGDLSLEPMNEKKTSPLTAIKQAPIIVRETMRGQLGGIPCELNLVMHMGLDKDGQHEQTRSFGESHKFLRGRVGGTAIMPPVNSQVLYILDGTVDLCWKNQRTPFTQYMHYYLLLGSASGARYVLHGKKEMRPFLMGLNLWAESTTLRVKFQQISPPMPISAQPSMDNKFTSLASPTKMQKQETTSSPVLEGTLKVSMFDLLKAVLTLRGPERFTLVRFLAESLIRTYIIRNPRASEDHPNQTVPQTPRDALRALARKEQYPRHILHEFTTEDGVTISAGQWVCPDKSENPSTSNIVLLLNGYSTESFWLPTEPTDIVRTLLHHGYEPWLLNSRLHPLHTTNRPLTLDDVAKFDVPAVLRKIAKVRGDLLPIHVIAFCIGGININMAILGGYVQSYQIASLVCTNTSMFFRVTDFAMAKIYLPLMPISMAILGKNTAFNTHSKSDDGIRHQLLRFMAKQIPRVEMCKNDACNTFSGVFGNTFWHANVSAAVHSYNTTPPIFPMGGMPQLRKILLKGHLVDSNGQETYMTHPERLAVPTTFINGGKELLVTQKTGRLGYEFMNRHHPQFVHAHKVVPNFGHADILFGEKSTYHVFPLIIDHLDRVRSGQHKSRRQKQVQEWQEESPNITPFYTTPFLIIGFVLLVFSFFIYNP